MATTTENKRKMIKSYLTAIASSIVLAAISAGLVIPNTALAAKGTGGKKGADVILVRADFVDVVNGDVTAIYSDGLASCSDDHPIIDEFWDYWDPQDPICTGGGQLRCDLSGGGRWKLNTGLVRPTERWVVFHWNLIQAGSDSDLASSAVSDASDPNLDLLIYGDLDSGIYPVVGGGGPPADFTPQIDNLNIRISADMVFKDTATRQPLEILIQQGGGSWPIYSLSYLDPLYVVPNYMGDQDLILLTTFGSGLEPDVDEAELLELVDPTTGESHKGNSKPVIGIYSMPFEVILRRVYVP